MILFKGCEPLIYEKNIFAIILLDFYILFSVQVLLFC